jgi:hypothetical protein
VGLDDSVVVLLASSSSRSSDGLLSTFFDIIPGSSKSGSILDNTLFLLCNTRSAPLCGVFSVGFGSRVGFTSKGGVGLVVESWGATFWPVELELETNGKGFGSAPANVPVKHLISINNHDDSKCERFVHLYYFNLIDLQMNKLLMAPCRKYVSITFWLNIIYYCG